MQISEEFISPTHNNNRACRLYEAHTRMRKTAKTYTNKIIQSTRLYGIEVELTRLGSCVTREQIKSEILHGKENRFFFEFKDDCSVQNSVEITSMPMSGDSVIRYIDEIQRVSYRARKKGSKKFSVIPNHEAGIHVHIDTGGMNFDSFKTAFAIYHLMQRDLYLRAAKRRMTVPHSQCCPVSIRRIKQLLDSSEEDMLSCELAWREQELGSSGIRYQQVFQHNTIELRMLHSSLLSPLIAEFVLLLVDIADYAVMTSSEKVKELINNGYKTTDFVKVIGTKSLYFQPTFKIMEKYRG